LTVGTAPFYVTTPIYYANGEPHIGNTYTTTYADTLARYHRAAGEETYFLTGTDEYGEKIATTAARQGLEPRALVDRVAELFRSTWTELGFTFHRFIRTTDPDHHRAVRHFFQTLHDRGEIYFGEYSGRYCLGCERFYADRELEDGKCPQHLVEPEKRSERNYFFRMSAHRNWLIAELEANPSLVTPERYRNEALAMLREAGLEDLSISRPRERLSWGIPLPFDESHVCYVWGDALVNYLTGIGYPDDPEWTRRWSGVHHVVGKDILKPHAVFWPTLLRAAGVPLYRQLHVHGYWNWDRRKISKSLGNMIDPRSIKARYGFEAFRYFLLREMVFGIDSDFSEEALVRRINADLANDLGNLVQRSLRMVHAYLGGVVPEASGRSGLEEEAARVARDVDAHMQAFVTARALAALWELVSAANKYLDQEAPWKLAKDPKSRERLATCLYEVLEGIRVIAVLLAPFLPETSERIHHALGAGRPPEPMGEAVRWGGLAPGTRTRETPPLFPRIETS
jgi:methionyl-tRNA synthetase